MTHLHKAKLHKAKLIRIDFPDAIELEVSLGFRVTIQARVFLHGVKINPKNATLDVIHSFVYDWLTSSDHIFILPLDATTTHNVPVYVYSDVAMHACLNDDLVDAGYAINSRNTPESLDM